MLLNQKQNEIGETTSWEGDRRQSANFSKAPKADRILREFALRISQELLAETGPLMTVRLDN